VPYGPFQAGDGQTVFLSVQNEREFASFCDRVLQKPALKTDERFASGPARFRNRDAFHHEIDAVFSQLQTAEIIERLETADIANARLNDMKRFWNHPQLRARGRWAKVGSPAGELDMLRALPEPLVGGLRVTLVSLVLALDPSLRVARRIHLDGVPCTGLGIRVLLPLQGEDGVPEPHVIPVGIAAVRIGERRAALGGEARCEHQPSSEGAHVIRSGKSYRPSRSPCS
jgi:hypothetical protein